MLRLGSEHDARKPWLCFAVLIICTATTHPAAADILSENRSALPHKLKMPPSLKKTFETKLQSLQLKKKFAATYFKVNPKTIGLSKPIAISPGRDKTYVANLYRSEFKPATVPWVSSDWLKVGGTYSLAIMPSAFDTSIRAFLVEATLRIRTRHNWTNENRAPHGEIVLSYTALNGQSVRQEYPLIPDNTVVYINAIVDAVRPESIIALNADDNESLQIRRLLITPVRIEQ